MSVVLIHLYIKKTKFRYCDNDSFCSYSMKNGFLVESQGVYIYSPIVCTVVVVVALVELVEVSEVVAVIEIVEVVAKLK